MNKIIPPPCKCNGYKVHYSKIHDNWLVSEKRFGGWVALEEFSTRTAAIKWAESH